MKLIRTPSTTKGVAREKRHRFQTFTVRPVAYSDIHVIPIT